MSLEPWQAAVLFGAAFVAGASNAVAGGGSLFSFPALLAMGYPSKVANVTSTIALWPGHVGGSWGYRAELASQRERWVLALPSILGGLVGSALLLYTPQLAFDILVPFLILFASALMAFQDRLAERVNSLRRGRREAASAQADDLRPLLRSRTLHLATFCIAIYGAYFGAGLGIMLLAMLGILLPDDIQRSNALKGVISLLINAVAVCYFALFGPVAWLPAGIMAGGALMGGYLGVGLARRLGRQRLRAVAITSGVVVALALLARLRAP